MRIVLNVTDKVRVAVTGALLVMLAGCVSTNPVTTEYYLLNSTSNASDAVSIDPFKLGVGPVELAAYLDDEGIANHLDSNKVVYSESKRWAGPLDTNIGQVLVSNLTLLLPNQTVYGFPWKVTQVPDYQLSIEILRFGWFPGNRVALHARVELEDSSGEIVYSGEENLERNTAVSDYQSNIAAQNQLLDQLSNRLVGILNGNVVPG